MKKYLGMVIALIAILTMGSASAIVFQTSILSANKSQLLIGTLGGGCGGHGCHNDTNMTEITGVLTYDDSTFMIEETILNVGCYYYLNTTSPYDFDGDGTIETRLNELLGMVGTTITVEGYLRCQQTKLIVFYINGIEYRDCGNSKYI
jgi:hypothetical protein